MSLSRRISTLTHRYLRIPYALHVHEFQSPKKPRATFVFIHGIGGSHESWQPVIQHMPPDVRLIGIDLLGFGNSPKPTWAVYNAKTQARSVAATLVKLRITRRVILVGHSLGALTAVEVVKRYGFVAKKMVLCSPPFYRPEVSGLEQPLTLGQRVFKNNEDILRAMYRISTKHPEQLIKFSGLAVRMGVANKAINVTDETVSSYIAALEASIINQTALEDIASLKLPIRIFYGGLDPVVIGKHIAGLTKQHDNISAKRILLAGHEVTNGYAKMVATYLTDSVAK